MSESTRISAQTRLFCLLGDPVSHSKSPAMMNAAFAAAGIDGVYLALRVNAPALGAVVSALKAVGCGGVNVTAPHKEAVIPFLDKLSAAAEASGSVNTIVFDGGSAAGHNTDGDGLVAAIEEKLGRPVGGKAIVILGAGGAVRGVLPALSAAGARSIVIANRSVAKAEELARRFAAAAAITAAPLTRGALSGAMAGADILINATALPVGSMTFLDIHLAALKPGALVFDMNYGRAPSDVGRLMAQHSLEYSDGLPMLLFQGARSFTLWTGKAPPLSVMRSALGL